MSEDTVKGGEDVRATPEQIAALMEEIRANNPPTHDPEVLGAKPRTNLGRRGGGPLEAEDLDKKMSERPTPAMGAHYVELSPGQARNTDGVMLQRPQGPGIAREARSWRARTSANESEPNPDDKGPSR